jgi:hypothetical protein
MFVRKPKCRMISIRLSDEEYTGLKTLCVERGARSVSELAREAMNRALKLTPGESGPGIDLRIQDLQSQLNLLDRRLTEVSARLEEKE